MEMTWFWSGVVKRTRPKAIPLMDPRGLALGKRIFLSRTGYPVMVGGPLYPSAQTFPEVTCPYLAISVLPSLARQAQAPRTLSARDTKSQVAKKSRCQLPSVWYRPNQESSQAGFVPFLKPAEFKCLPSNYYWFSHPWSPVAAELCSTNPQQTSNILSLSCLRNTQRIPASGPRADQNPHASMQ